MRASCRCASRPSSATARTPARSTGRAHGASPRPCCRPRDFADRESYGRALGDIVESHAPQLVVLAGFMRILSDEFVLRFSGRMLNIHPSLLPKYAGLHTHRRALEAGDREHGASVHFVTPELDGGPVVLQARVPVLPGDDEDSLAARVLREEHVIYPQLRRLVCGGPARLPRRGGLAGWQRLDAPVVRGNETKEGA